MKRLILCLLLSVSVLCSCAQMQTQLPTEEKPSDSGAAESDVPSAGETPAVDSLLQDYLTALPVLEQAVREYGESVSHILMDDELHARILYPVSGLSPLDGAVEDWVLQMTEMYRRESADSTADGDSAELTVDYSSYLIGDTVVSIRLDGIYDRPYLAHPVEISAAFNADREKGVLLTLADVLLPGGEAVLRDMVIRDAGMMPQDADEHLLDHWGLTHDGLEITLVRGEYLPMSAGTVTLLYSYEELDGIFTMPNSSSQDSEQGEQGEQEPEMPDTPRTELDPERPMLALTFDDGPSAHTERLLDVFATHGGKGTFFVVGNMLDARKDVLKRVASEGHEIGGHSWNHRKLTKLSREEVTDQLMNTRAKIYEITGVDTMLVRPPYGSSNKQVRGIAEELGIFLINWSVDTQDWKLRNADAVYEAVMTAAKDGAIILCHDLHKTTVEAMERVVPALIAEGYQLVTVTELLTSKGGVMEPGIIYHQR